MTNDQKYKQGIKLLQGCGLSGKVHYIPKIDILEAVKKLIKCRIKELSKTIRKTEAIKMVKDEFGVSEAKVWVILREGKDVRTKSGR